MKVRLFILQFTLWSFSSNAQWQFKTTGTTNDLHAVKFLSIDTGFIAGYATFLQTFDGGDTWLPNPTINPDSFAFYDIEFPSKNVGYMVGGSTDGVTIFKTVDSGQSWSDISPVGTSVFYNASFLNRDTGFVSGLGSKIYKTFDGGENWEVILSSSLGGPYYRWIQFISVDTGYVCASHTGFDDALLLKTTDGGSNLDPAWPTIITLPPFNSNKNFQFFDAKFGYAGIANINKTETGGNSWIQLFLPNNSASLSLYFLSRDTGFVAGNVGFASAIYKTFDGGNLWFQCETQYPDSQYYLNEIYFVDKDYGYAVGSFGVFMKTTNGGGFTEVENLEATFTFSMHPNPAKDQLMLSLKLQGIRAQAKIFDLLGTKFIDVSFNSADQIIDVSSLPYGMYFLHLKTDRGNALRKFIKQ
ncbi:MAG: T9SS type A sorting domain-containing protein [Chitinophagaceae bacterium]|nr:T9SS type A sorting domain-containing protein [Chitinophagaceae bacterium]